MIRKSTVGALFMAGIASFSMLATYFLWRFVGGAFMPGLAGLQVVSFDDVLVTVPALLLLALILALPGALIIRNWSESHFGPGAAVRWVIFGILAGSLMQIPVLLPEGILGTGSIASMVDKGLSAGLGILVFYLAYYVAFKLPRR